jgi:CRP/FNR family transcriptional regulator, cyclic AMP receptor protein
MSNETPLDLLAKVDLFSDLSKKELAKVHDAGKEVHFASGRAIVTEGEEGVGFHMILEGKAAVTVGGQVRGHLGPGDYFGEIAIIDSGPRSASVTAESDVVTYAIASWDFMPVLTENFELTKKILVELCRRLRRAEDSLKH